jgi:hypothetical protein
MATPPRPKIAVTILRGSDMYDPHVLTVCVGIKATRDGRDWCWKGPVVSVSSPSELVGTLPARAIKGAVEAMLNDPHTAELVKEG